MSWCDLSWTVQYLLLCSMPPAKSIYKMDWISDEACVRTGKIKANHILFLLPHLDPIEMDSKGMNIFNSTILSTHWRIEYAVWIHSLTLNCDSLPFSWCILIAQAISFAPSPFGRQSEWVPLYTLYTLYTHTGCLLENDFSFDTQSCCQVWKSWIPYRPLPGSQTRLDVCNN